MVVIEMNPRVSRSSALASKATGFPIAKIAAKLAIGYTLDELQQRNHRRRDAGILRAVHRLRRHQDATLRLREIPASRAHLTTQMKSVGEVMAIGRTFQESLQKALRGLEVGVCGLDEKLDLADEAGMSIRKRELVPGAERIWYVADAFRAGLSVEDIFGMNMIDPWFLVQIEDLIKDEEKVKTRAWPALTAT